MSTINSSISSIDTVDTGKNILLDVIATIETESFISTFVDAYKRGITKKTFTLRQWKVLKKIFRDNESHWDEIFNKTGEAMIYFPESKNGEEDYNIFTIYKNHTYDHWSHGMERLVVKEN